MFATNLKYSYEHYREDPHYTPSAPVSSPLGICPTDPYPAVGHLEASAADQQPAAGHRHAPAFAIEGETKNLR